ncbi:hypothetical protein KEM54_005205 [Ascosphaera aggregata]|nr:hypothetical protein KEM54_005205 [Ascosphaera aggregata]
MAEFYEGRNGQRVVSYQEPRIDTSSIESMADSGKSVKGGEDVFLNIARSSSTRKIGRNSMPSFPREKRSSKSGIPSRLGSRHVGIEEAPVPPPLGSPVRKGRLTDGERDRSNPRLRRSPPSLHPLDEASRMRYFGRHPRSVDNRHIDERSPSAIDGRLPRSSISVHEDAHTHTQSHNHQVPSYVPNSKQCAGSSLSSSTHNSRSWGSSCSTEKQPYAQQESVLEEPENASSTVWNELDDLKLRIKRLEITGKIEPPPDSHTIRERDDRPRTAVTESPRYVIESPKRSQSAAAETTSPAEDISRSQLEGSITPSNGGSSGIDVNQLHPLLHTSLAKVKPHVGTAVYRALQNTTQDALVLAALLGSTATGTNSNNTGLGISLPMGDRQARRKADSVCRDLTELCLALADDIIDASSKSKGNSEIEFSNGADGSQDVNAYTNGIVDASSSGNNEYDRPEPVGMDSGINDPEYVVNAPIHSGGYHRRNESSYYDTSDTSQQQQVSQGFSGLQRMPSTAPRREKRNSAFLNPPANPLASNTASPRNSLIIDSSSAASPQTQLSVDAVFTAIQLTGAKAAKQNAKSTNSIASPAIAPSSSSRLSRLSTVFKTRRLQQEIGLDTAPDHTIDNQINQSSPIPLSAVPGGNVRSRTVSRVSFANGPLNKANRLSLTTSGFRERRLSREIAYDSEVQAQQQQQQQEEQQQQQQQQQGGQPAQMPRVRQQSSAFSRIQTGSVTPQFSFQAPLRTRTFTPHASTNLPQQQQQQQSSAGSTVSTHVPLANYTNMNVQPGLRRFGLGAMLGKKQAMSTGDGGTKGAAAGNSPTSPAVPNFLNSPNGNEKVNASVALQGFGIRTRTTQPLHLRPRTRSVGNAAPARTSMGAAAQNDGANNASGAYSSNAPPPQSVQNVNTGAMRRVSLRPRLRSTHSTEGL